MNYIGNKIIGYTIGLMNSVFIHISYFTLILLNIVNGRNQTLVRESPRAFILLNLFIVRIAYVGFILSFPLIIRKHNIKDCYSDSTRKTPVRDFVGLAGTQTYICSKNRN